MDSERRNQHATKGAGDMLDAQRGSAEAPLGSAPSEYARPARVEFFGGAAHVDGYQAFDLTVSSIAPTDRESDLARKHLLLASLFCPRYLAHRTLLDIGANAGFYSFWALQSGAERAIALEMDDSYAELAEEISAALGFPNFTVERGNVSQWSTPADVVLALALIHWIYSCTAVYGDLDAVVDKLASLTKYMLLVEWIDPADPAIGSFGHLDWNKEKQRGAYTLAAFEQALGCHFARYQMVGEVTSSRRLYAAFRTPHDIDLSGPLPLLTPKELVISSRYLARYNGVEYWSRVYDGGEAISKQATLDLAVREARFLRQLDSSYFPHVLDSRVEGAWSLITLEKIHGTALPHARQRIADSPERFLAFVKHCLSLLRELREHGIVHRDIQPGNILIRDNKPVLLDFGWAISEEQPYFTPQGLECSGGRSDDSDRDVYSMGKVLEEVNQHTYPEFDAVIELMTAREPYLREADLGTLEVLFASAAASSTCGGRVVATRLAGTTHSESQERPSDSLGSYASAIHKLLQQISELKRRLSRLRDEQESLARQASHDEEALRTIEAQLAAMRASGSWRLTAPCRWIACRVRQVSDSVRLLQSATRTEGGYFGAAGRTLRVLWREGVPGLRSRLARMRDTVGRQRMR